jgi:hypothetical protein
VKTTRVRKGPRQDPGQADESLFVAHGDIAPGEDGEEFAVAPAVAPVVTLGKAGLDDEGVGIHEGKFSGVGGAGERPFGISLNTSAHLTRVSKHTRWRRIAAGHLRGEKLPDPHGRTLIPLAAIAADIGLALGDEETAVIQQADAGVAAAQQELALIFLQAGRPDRARPWLDLAAEQGYANALFCLGEARIAAPMTDPSEGLALIRRAAVAGHPLALAVMEGLRARRGP